MRERDIERYLVDQVVAIGGEVRKLKWIGRRGAPDRLVMLPSVNVDRQGAVREYSQRTIWVELKAPGAVPEPHQKREHQRMRKMGQVVIVIDSFEGVDALLS